MNKPLLSISCITYNHEKYIAQAIEGFLLQKASFPIEIIIHDDASTDSTAKIVKEYVKKYPNIIIPIFQKENQYSRGIKPSTNFVFPKCRGKYIALCEGDDYWTDPYKLQKQVDFLEANLDYIVCYHNAAIIDEEGKLIRNSKLPDNLKTDFSSDDLKKGVWILTLTMCFRNVLKKFPEEFFKVKNGDKFLTSLLGNYGKGKYMEDILDAVYRKHSTSVWSSLDEINQIYYNGDTRAWLFRYYCRIGEIRCTDYLKNEVVSHFNQVIKYIVAHKDKNHNEIINNILFNYSDVINNEILKHYKNILLQEGFEIIVSASKNDKPENCEENAYSILNPSSNILGIGNVTKDYHLYRKSQKTPVKTTQIAKVLNRSLTNVGWNYKKEIYEKYIDAINSQNISNSPTISIVVISWRLHPDNLKSFQILEKQRDQNFELIFVDNGGKDGEFDVLKPFITTYIKLNTNTGAYLARNVGALFAKAPILFFLEDDGLPAPNLIQAHLQAFEKYDVIAVRGVYLPKSEDNPFNALANHYYLGDQSFPRYSDLEGNTSYDAKMFYKVGGWDDEITFGGGGIDLSIRLINIESDMKKQIYSPEPMIYHDYVRDKDHLKTKREKQMKSFERLRKKHNIFDSFQRRWDSFYGRSELVFKRKTNFDSAKIDVSIEKNTLLVDINHYYKLGDLNQTERLLCRYQNFLKEGI